MEQLGDGANASIRITDADNGARVIRLEGELDISNVSDIEAQLLPLADRIDGAASPIFDLSQLSFMDSSGIAMLLRAAEKVGPITVRDPSRVVRQIIDSSGLGEILRVEP
jgi:anti-anti-sigma factor